MVIRPPHADAVAELYTGRGQKLRRNPRERHGADITCRRDAHAGKVRAAGIGKHHVQLRRVTLDGFCPDTEERLVLHVLELRGYRRVLHRIGAFLGKRLVNDGKGYVHHTVDIVRLHLVVHSETADLLPQFRLMVGESPLDDSLDLLEGVSPLAVIVRTAPSLSEILEHFVYYPSLSCHI